MEGKDLRKAGLKLSLGQLLAQPTIEGLASLFAVAAEPQLGRPPAVAALPSGAGKTIPRTSRAGDLGLSHAQRRLWFLWRLEPRSGAYNLPAAVRLRGALDSAVLEQTTNLSVSVIIGQIRSTAVDLLRSIGTAPEEARALIRGDPAPIADA